LIDGRRRKQHIGAGLRLSRHGRTKLPFRPQGR
jgi:hypothetical protein